MPVIMREVSVAAGGLNENIFSGSAFEIARQAQVVSLGVAQSATGGFATFQSGGDVVAEEFSPPVLTRYPVIPDEMYFNDVQTMGDRNVLRYRNPTAGAITVRALLQISPIGG